MKAPAGPFKVKPSLKSQYGLIDGEYALNALAILYIKDTALRKMVALFYWCGTPTTQYVMTNETPSEQALKERAAEIEERWGDGTGEKRLPR